MSEKNTLLIPHSIEAERGVIGSILIDRGAHSEVITHITAECFFADTHRKIFQCISSMIESDAQAIDVITISHELKKRGVFDEIGGAAYLVTLMGAVPHAANAEYYAKIVREKFILRTLIGVCEKISTEAYKQDDVQELLIRSEKRILGIFEGLENIQQKTFGEILKETFDAIYERMDREDEVHGLRMGFTNLDEMSTGLKGGELVVLAARPAMGKTALVCNIAVNALNQDCGGVMLFSMEQSRLELSERLLCIRSRVSGHALRKGKISEDDQNRLMQAAHEMQDLELVIDDVPGRTMSHIAAISRRVHRKSKLSVIIIDYLQLIESEDPRQLREQHISSVTRRLKFLAKELDVPVIVLSQLNRGLEQRDDKRPRLSDLRESGAIEQDADIVMFLYRPEVYNKDDRPGQADIIVAKNRHGPTGVVDLVWLKDQLKFADKSNVEIPGLF